LATLDRKRTLRHIVIYRLATAAIGRGVVVTHGAVAGVVAVVDRDRAMRSVS